MMAACAILLLTGAFTVAVPPLELVATPEIQSTAGHLEAYFDESLIRSMNDVVHGNLLQPHAGFSYARPLRTGATWMRLRLHNPGAQTLTRAVRIHNTLIDELDGWLEDATGTLVHGEAGEGIDVEQRLVPTRQPTFQLEVPPRETRALYLRLRSAGTMSCIISVAPLPVYEHQESIRQLVTGMLWGMYCLVTLYCGYFFLRFRKALYGWLALTTICVQVVLAFYFWAEASYWFPARIRVAVSDPIIHTSVVAAAASLVAFLRELLNLRAMLPRVDRVLRGCLLVYLAVLLAFPFMNSVSRTQFINLLILTLVIPVGAAGWLALRKDRVAAITCASVGILVAGTCITLVRNLGLIPDGSLPENASTFAFAFFILVLAMAAGDRMEQNRAERELALQARLGAAERNAQLTRTFARFVPIEFLHRLERKDITEFELGQSIEKVMTTLFSDIRGFTSMVESMSPQENFAFINEYLGYMEPAIHAHGGFIDKYIGDAVMALFDDGRDAENGALRGVRAAVAMQRGVDAFNAMRQLRGEPEIAIGLGLHTGAVMLGTIGGRDRLNASVIGDAVNLASRVEGMTKIYSARILITETTADALPDVHGFRLRVIDRVRVKGKNAPVTVLEVLDGEPPEQRERKLRTLTTYQSAWEKYQAGSFTEAMRLLATCGPDASHDAAISRLSERCAIMLREGTPDRWDGAITLTEK